MPNYSVDHFLHGAWASLISVIDDANFDNACYKDLIPSSCPENIKPNLLYRIGCNTRCCLVGSVRHAFGLAAQPSVGKLTKPAARFLNKICELAGEKFNSMEDKVSMRECYITNLEIHASNLFENRLTDEEVYDLYHTALKHFGYTEDV